MSRYFSQFALFLITVLFAVASVAQAQRPVIAMVTDFGTQNEAVGLCRGAIAAIDPEILVIDLNNTIDTYDIQQASFVISRADTFPTGTVILTVVDPGVGTSRGAVAIETTAGLVLVGPDNGVFTHAIRKFGMKRAVKIDPLKVNPDWKPGTFDGRDLFSPAAAMLASEPTRFSELGQPVAEKDLVTLPLPEVKVEVRSHTVRGTYVRTDEPYGNVWTDIEPEDLQKAGIRIGTQVEVTSGDTKITMPLVRTFGDVPEGKPLAYIGSAGTLALALNMGNFRETYKLEPGAEILVRRGGNEPHPKRLWD